MNFNELPKVMKPAMKKQHVLSSFSPFKNLVKNTDSDSSDPQWSPRFSNFNKFPGPLAHGSHFEYQQWRV